VRHRRTARRGVSAGAEARLAAELGEELARTRTAWEAATLRGDAALQAGDRATAVRALAEQRALLHDLQCQVDTVVGRALVEREAETIVASETSPGARWGSRGGVRATVAAVVAAMIGLVSVGASTPPPAPDVAPLAGASDDRVAVASERVQPIEVAFDRVADVLSDLRSVLRTRHGGAGSDPDGGPRVVSERPETTTAREHTPSDAGTSEVDPAGEGARTPTASTERGSGSVGPSSSLPADPAPADLGLGLAVRQEVVELPAVSVDADLLGPLGGEEPAFER
jgi:hypothetical protein